MKTNQEKLAEARNADRTDNSSGTEDARKVLLFDLMIRHFVGTVFSYDVVRKELFYARSDGAGRYEEAIVNELPDATNKQAYLECECGIPADALLHGADLAAPKTVVEYQASTEQKGLLWYRSVYEQIVNEEGAIQHIIGYTESFRKTGGHTDKTMQKECDTLTQLYNRETTERLVDERLKSLQSGEKGVLFLFNIDNFRQINERFGEAFGDGCLRSIASMIHADFRYVDILGRIGGDDFAIFIKGAVSIDIVERRAQQILDLFLRIQVPEGQSLSCSIGIAVTSTESMRYAKLAMQAGAALKEAKDKGGRRYRMYEG